MLILCMCLFMKYILYFNGAIPNVDFDFVYFVDGVYLEQREGSHQICSTSYLAVKINNLVFEAKSKCKVSSVTTMEWKRHALRTVI